MCKLTSQQRSNILKVYAKVLHLQLQVQKVKLNNCSVRVSNVTQMEYMLQNSLCAVMMLIFKFSMYDISLLTLKKEITDMYTQTFAPGFLLTQAQWQQLEQKVYVLHEETIACIQNCVKNTLEKEYLLLQCPNM